jgi:hypothetical protein
MHAWRRCLLFLFALLVMTTGAAFAAPPEPGAGKLDWLRLSSGEWLRGELKYMRQETLEFDSDKLDLLKLKWEDVSDLRISRSLTWVFTNNRAATGPAVLRDSVVRVVENGQTKEFRKAELLSIIAGQGSELSLWSGNFSLGFVGRSGNTDQIDYNAMGFVRRDARTTRTDLKYAGNFGELEGVRSVNNQLGNARFDVFVSHNLFITPAAGELYADEFQNIELRASLTAGAGVYVIKKGPLEWFFQLGGGYLSTSYRSVEAGEDSQDQSAAIIPATALEWEPTGDITLNVDYNANISIPDTDKLFHHFVAMLTLENLKFIDLNTSVTWDHVAQPKARSDGTVPDKNDLRTSFGIGIDF